MQRITLANIALSISILLGTGFLARGYSLAGLDSFSHWFLFLGFIWLVAQYNRWDWFSAAALIAVILASILGLWLNLHGGWMIAASIFSLIAWDLTEFNRRIRTMSKDNLRGIELRHTTRLSLLALAGITFASLLLLLRRQFTFDWGILLIVMIVILLIQFIIGWRVN